MRLASASLLVLFASACTLTSTQNPDGSTTYTGKPTTRFVLDQKPVRQLAYTGQAIEILNDGVNPGTGTGVTVVGQAGATNVSATASIVSLADGTEVENAKKAQNEVVESFTIAEVGGKIVVRCGHAKQDYGTAKVSGTGCEDMVVTVPAGDASKPISLVAKSGNSGAKVSGLTGSVTVEALGSGNVDASITPAKGSVVSVSGGFDVLLRLPASFAADKVIVEARDAANIDTTAFPGLKSGEGYGTAGTGATSVTARSTGLLGDVKLLRQ